MRLRVLTNPAKENRLRRGAQTVVAQAEEPQRLVHLLPRRDQSGDPGFVPHERPGKFQIDEPVSQRPSQGKVDFAVQVDVTKLPAAFDVELRAVHPRPGCPAASGWQGSSPATSGVRPTPLGRVPGAEVQAGSDLRFLSGSSEFSWV